MRTHTTRLFTLLLLGSLLGCADGAGDAPERFTVSGTVKYDDQPVVEGDIVFKPEDGKGQPEAGKVTNGSYSLQTTAGKKRVEIIASREIPGKMVESGAEPGKKEPAREDYIPAKYNSESELKADVTAEGDNKFDFPLKSK